jgi:hypothetical protein
MNGQKLIKNERRLVNLSQICTSELPAPAYRLLPAPYYAFRLRRVKRPIQAPQAKSLEDRAYRPLGAQSLRQQPYLLHELFWII